MGRAGTWIVAAVFAACALAAAQCEGGAFSAANDGGTEAGLDASDEDCPVFVIPNPQQPSDATVGSDVGVGDASGGPDASEAGPGPACTPGVAACTGDGGTTPETCSDAGQWQLEAPCAYVCNAGACSGMCAPGTAQCNGDQPQKCNATGTWQNVGSPCPNVCTGGSCAGMCTPGTLQCSYLQPQKCGSNGTWADDGAACQYVCSQGKCIGSCPPGANDPVA
jgi:hypothetical protein